MKLKLTDASFSIRREFVTGIADALERSVHVDALAIVAHSSLTAFVHVDAERTDGRRRETFSANALKRSRNIFTAAVEADARIFQTLVNV